MAESGTGTGSAVGAASGKTLAQLRTMCQYAGWNDNSTNGLSALDDFINDTLHKLAALAPWPEYLFHDGSVTLVASDDDYDLTTSNAGDDNEIAKVGTVIRTDRRSPLEEIPIEEWLSLLRVSGATGSPDFYALRRKVTSGTGITITEMLVYPNPTSSEAGNILYFTYKVPPIILNAADDVTDWPTDRLWLFRAAVSVRITKKDRDAGGFALYSADFQKLINQAFAYARPSYMPVPVFPVNTSVRGRRIIDNVKINITS